MKKISIVIPCYNEEEVLPLTYAEMKKYMTPDYDFNLIFVNDGSKDKTLEIIKNLSETDSRVKYVSFSRNFGKEAAMYAGLEAAKAIDSDAAIISDADLQDPPSLWSDMLKYYEDGYKHVYAKHRSRKGANIITSFFALAFYKVYAFVTKDNMMAKGARDFCLLDRQVIGAFLSIKDFERFTKGIYHFVGFKKKCIEFDYVPRAAGTTKWGFRKLLRYAFTGIREFSRFYEYIPKVLAILTFLLLGYDITMGILNQSMDWIAIRLDAFMFVLFITLFYVYRLIYDVRIQVQNRPIYIMDESNIDATENKKED